MKFLTLLLVLTLSNLAFATPGDIGCEAELNGKKIELLIGYDVFEQNVPSLIEIKEEGVVVFTSKEVEAALYVLNAGEPPYTANALIANDEEATAIVLSQEQFGGGLTSVVLTVETDSQSFKVENLKMSCNL